MNHESFSGTLGRVQDDAMAPTGIQPVHRLEEAVGNGVGPHQGVVNTFGLLRDVHDEFIEASAVGIPWCDVALQRNTVTIAAPRSDEGGEEPILFRERDAVVAVPRIKHEPGEKGTGCGESLWWHVDWEPGNRQCVVVCRFSFGPLPSGGTKSPVFQWVQAQWPRGWHPGPGQP